MSVKSTIKLTREEAIKQLVSDNKFEELISKFFDVIISNEGLEDMLEQMDEANGKYFNNYLIIDKKEEN